ncbi:class I SAM-dependent methyltransferase [Halocola ammonii]
MDKREKFWNRVASKSPEVPGTTTLNVISRTRQHLKPEDEVLEIGCGNGAITIELATSVKHVDAIDISSEMLELAREAATKKSLQNIDFHWTKLENLSVVNGSYSIVTTFSVLHYIENPTNFASQVHKLLKPGGIFISTTPCLGERKNLTNILLSFLSKIRILPPINFYKKRDLENSIVKAGFEIVESEVISKLEELYLVVRKSR